jgi:hypothetical protein
MARPDFPLSIDRRRLLKRANSAVGSDFFQPPQLAFEAEPANSSAGVMPSQSRPEARAALPVI